jgi:translation initiation factor 2 subunit 3
LQKAGVNLEEAGAGGLLGVMTTLDPSLTKSDALVGNLVGVPGKLPETREQLTLEIKLLERVVGSDELKAVAPIRVGENLMVNIGTSRSIGVVSAMKKEKLELKLKLPLCVEEKDRVVISRQISGRWRLIGYGTII